PSAPWGGGYTRVRKRHSTRSGVGGGGLILSMPGMYSLKKVMANTMTTRATTAPIQWEGFMTVARTRGVDRGQKGKLPRALRRHERYKEATASIVIGTRGGSRPLRGAPG